MKGRFRFRCRDWLWTGIASLLAVSCAPSRSVLDVGRMEPWISIHPPRPCVQTATVWFQEIPSPDVLRNESPVRARLGKPPGLWDLGASLEGVLRFDACSGGAPSLLVLLSGTEQAKFDDSLVVPLPAGWGVPGSREQVRVTYRIARLGWERGIESESRTRPDDATLELIVTTPRGTKVDSLEIGFSPRRLARGGSR